MAKRTWKSIRAQITEFDLTPGLASRVEGLAVQLDEAGVPAPSAVAVTAAGKVGTVRLEWTNAGTNVAVEVHTKAPTTLHASTPIKRLASVKLIVDALSDA